ncbi:dihydrofolate reductase family protein [Robiginitalea aurantiaca]|uniref:Dihydrofolate reductase family protein n=1 Tax=Robiginitalea aurantiaca TaxID=3056915 RepID=A0ABT7WEX0_9FLAO|nr:dihydrofolate reductase family protein [Robiginitalea aurantiaca]MDM9631465.1 dihydrofolate reductase family protein [Robiginitalea aurantiaca]
MLKKNSVFIASSLDGYIADKKGGIDWLHTIPNPNQEDMGYTDFINRIDALVMGRQTFETVCGFNVVWPYSIPVFVLSNSLKEIPEDLKEKVFLTQGSPGEILAQIHQMGFFRLYIDGGVTIRNFLKADLIDEMILTTIPILLGGGSPLFSELPKALQFELAGTKTFLDQVTQNHYLRKRHLAL